MSEFIHFKSNPFMEKSLYRFEDGQIFFVNNFFVLRNKKQIMIINPESNNFKEFEICWAEDIYGL